MRKRFILLILLMLTAITVAGTTYANLTWNNFEKIGERIYVINEEDGSIDFVNLAVSSGQFDFFGTAISLYEKYDSNITYRVVMYNYLTNVVHAEFENVREITLFEMSMIHVDIMFWENSQNDELPINEDMYYARNMRIYFIDILSTEDLAPVISGVSKIAKSTEAVLTLDTITEMLTATDEIDGNLTNNITVKNDNFTGNGNVLGSHNITFTVTDSANNTTNHTVVIEVIEGLPEIMHFIDDNRIILDTSMFLEPLEIIQVLTASGLLELDGTASVVFTTNEYQSNEDIAGIYDIKIEYTSSTGVAETFSIIIEVVEDQEETIKILDTGIIGDVQIFITENSDFVIGVVIFSIIIGFLYFKFPNKKKRRK